MDLKDLMSDGEEKKRLMVDVFYLKFSGYDTSRLILLREKHAEEADKGELYDKARLEASDRVLKERGFGVKSYAVKENATGDTAEQEALK